MEAIIIDKDPGREDDIFINMQETRGEPQLHRDRGVQWKSQPVTIQMSFRVMDVSGELLYI